MNAVENKQFIQRVYDDAATGNLQTFLDALSDDVEWTIIGSTKFSKTYRGKQAVINELLGALAP